MLLLILLVFFAQNATGDELISARCQSKCLHDMEFRYQDNVEQRRNLKHQIIQMCKDDVLCSACASPCRESFVSLVSCKDNCKESMDKEACEQSCEFLERIYKEKPGACPKMSNSSNYECTALCHLDGDCGETAKCCSYGCSRQCVQPRGRDPRLLPVPVSISIQERKRKRSIIIRWVMQKLSKEQANANANLFVVQWRWGLHTDSSSMTEWQTVAVRNKPYAILKHLLSPGRFYEFRVGAVNQFGSLGFSKASEPFKLSKEAKAPGPPKDLSLGKSKLTSVGLWNQMVQWTPPPSDLPIKNYQVSWAASSTVEADSFEEMMRRRATLETHDKRSTDEEDDAWGIEARDRHSLVVPSHTTQAELQGLFPNSVYIVEIHASVDSTEGELQGEKGIIFVRTADAYTGEMQETTSTTSSSAEIDVAVKENLNVPVNNDSTDMAPPQDIDVQTPFFEGELQTTINWLDARICGPGKALFIVKVKKGECREYQTHNMDIRWHDIKVHECAATLKGLSFNCDYHVQIVDSSRPDHPITTTFSTQSCDKTPSASTIPCLSLTTPLLCSAHGARVSCKWSKDRDATQDTVIGYRIVLSSANSDAHNITINPPQSREILYNDLKQGEMYTVEVQSITNRGMGKSFSTNFIAPSIFDSNLIDTFPGGEIIELPLEASSSHIYCLICSLLILLLRLF